MASEETKNGIPIYVSQDDIDIALAGVDITEEAEVLTLDDAEIIMTETDENQSDSEDSDYFGQLSSSDIETMLHEGDVDLDGADAQNEIDQLMQSALSDPGLDPPEEKTDAIVSPGDIEDLLNDAIGNSAESEAPGKEAPAPEEAGDSAVSQGDIDALLNGGGSDSAESEAPGEEASAPEEASDSAVSQGDIDALLNGGGSDSAESEAPAEDASAPEEAGDSAVSQGDIDQLLNGDGSGTQETPGTAPDASEEDGTSMISQDDLDKLLTGAIESELPETEETDQKPDSEPQEETSSGDHISQDDLNSLLQESIEEEGLDQGFDEDEEGEGPAPVILAEDDDIDESEDAGSKETSAAKEKKVKQTWYRKKPVIAAIAASFLFVVVGSAMFFSGGEEEALTTQLVHTFPIVPSSEEAPMMLHSDTAVSLKGFLVLVPSNPSGITYMAADLLFEVADETVFAIIKDNEAFVRSIIYGVMNHAMTAQELSNVNEIQLVLAIRKALGTVIPREAIGQVYFHKFSMV